MLTEIAPCPVCGGQVLTRYGSRPQGVCAKCFSKERTRTIQALLIQLDLLEPGRSVLHVAPERALSQNLSRTYGARYAASDIRAEALDFLEPDVQRIVTDLVDMSGEFLAGRYDVIVHSHVMEHVRGSWQVTFLRLHTLLNAGGWHVFAVPLMRDWSSEDLSDMMPQERQKRFGQHDHYRWIGRRDFNRDMYSIAALTGSEPLRDAAEILGPEIMDRIAGDRDVYVLRKAP